MRYKYKSRNFAEDGTLKITVDMFSRITVFSVMFGDRLDTDIQFGINCGLTTVLTLTGITSETDAQKSSIKPDYIIPDFTKIL